MSEETFTGKITIRDVAARAGVALSSVSRVMSGHPDVSLAMRARVEEAVSTLGYEPDLIAQSLRSGSTRIIGFIIRDISNPLYALVARACEQELQRHGYSMILMNSDANIETESKNFQIMRRRRVDGVIASLVDEGDPSVKKSLISLNAAIVLLDREVKGIHTSAVLTNHYQGVYEATKHLLDAGHTKIGFVTGDENVYTTRNRMRGFKQAFGDIGKEIDESFLALGGFDAEYAFVHTHNLMTSQPRPTALMTGGISSTWGALRALKKIGLKVGEDLAFVALDEWPLFDIFSPEISCVYRDARTIGAESAHMMLQILKSGVQKKLIIETKFTARFSSGGGL